jgi:hypothetical protein
MQTARIIANRRARLLAGMAALVAAVLLLPTPPTASAAGQSYDCDYFSGPDHSTIVGWKYHPCVGLNQQWGTITPYSSCLYSTCPGGGGGGN